MKTRPTTALLALALLGFAGTQSATADAQARVCRGSLARVTVAGNLQVPAGATCALSRSQVGRDLLVELARRSSRTVSGSAATSSPSTRSASSCGGR